MKKADESGQIPTVSEFLSHVRRTVVDFVISRVLGSDGAVEATVDRLAEPTAYYLFHRNHYGVEDSPIGACILWGTACGLSDPERIRDRDLLVTSGEIAPDQDDDEKTNADEPLEESGSGSKVKSKP